MYTKVPVDSGFIFAWAITDNGSVGGRGRLTQGSRSPTGFWLSPDGNTVNTIAPEDTTLSSVEGLAPHSGPVEAIAVYYLPPEYAYLDNSDRKYAGFIADTSGKRLCSLVQSIP